MRALPRLHVVTDDEVIAGERFLLAARDVLDAGGGRVALHLRGPRTSGARLFQWAEALMRLARRSGALLLINDRVDVALASGADGVQLGARSLRPADARRVLGSRWIGASVHGGREARAAVAEGADFLVVGTLFATASHPGREGKGVAILEELSSLSVPLIGIGGIDPERVRAARDTGAAGVAALRGVWSHPDPARAVMDYLEELGKDGE